MNNEKMDLIEHYLLDDLTDVEKAEKDRLLKEDAEFKAIFTEHKALIEGIKFSGRNELMDTFRKIETRNYAAENRETPARSLRKYYIGIAASIGLLLLSYVGVQEFYFKTPEKIAASYFEPYPAIIGGVTRSAEEDQTVLETAMTLFDSGKYKEAIAMFKLIESAENEELIDFYLGNALQSTQQYEESIAIYEEIIAKNGLFKDQAEWYLALAYLQTERVEMAEELLQSIKNSGNDYSERAGKVLDSID